MKQLTKGKQYVFSLFIGLAITACGNHAAKQTEETVVGDSTEQVVIQDTADFDLRKIPISEVSLGEFPYLTPPDDYCFDYCQAWKGSIKKDDIKALDREFFAFNGKLVAIEGKSYKQTIEKNRTTDQSRFSALFVEKAFHNALLDLGAVEVNGVEVPYSEIERIGKQEVLDYGHAIDFNGLDHIHTYIIRKEDKVIWIQFSLLDNESGKITIMESTDKLS
ncbi:hypothetical protein ACFRAE_06450 [Sphingobacterium sp. HJSM2_6]|uniref:hypothetical protein n=1 Tax=Sphingobacterium sp. HJSM2_6 TaxID=3366264 RepID=UPI003BD2C39C